jgi:hypothetical protein
MSMPTAPSPPESRVVGELIASVERLQHGDPHPLDSPTGQLDAAVLSCIGQLCAVDLRDSYQAGEIGWQEFLRLTVVCARLLPWFPDLALNNVNLAVTTEPRRRARRPPPVPRFVRGLAVNILLLLARECPGRPVTAATTTEPFRAPLLDATLCFLEHVGFVPAGRISPKTLYGWYRDRQVRWRKRRGRRRRRLPPRRAVTDARHPVRGDELYIDLLE